MWKSGYVEIWLCGNGEIRNCADKSQANLHVPLLSSLDELRYKRVSLRLTCTFPDFHVFTFPDYQAKKNVGKLKTHSYISRYFHISTFLYHLVNIDVSQLIFTHSSFYNLNNTTSKCGHNSKLHIFTFQG